MRRAILYVLLCVLALTLTASPALACLQFRESQIQEREFKSNYLDQPSPVESQPSGYYTQVVTVSSLGGVLLVGGFVLGLGKRRGA
jgi:hypothetical protein